MKTESSRRNKKKNTHVNTLLQYFKDVKLHFYEKSCYCYYYFVLRRRLRVFIRTASTCDEAFTRVSTFFVLGKTKKNNVYVYDVLL